MRIEDDMHCSVNINTPDVDKNSICSSKELIRQSCACCLMAIFASKIFDAADSTEVICNLHNQFKAEKQAAYLDKAKLLPVIAIMKILEQWYTEV